MSSNITTAIAFERTTTLPKTVVNTANIILSSNSKKQLHQHRVKFESKLIRFNNNRTIVSNHYVTADPISFECLLVYNGVVSKYPKLTAGIKRPDEFYLDMSQKNAFIIEKKTQEITGSVDEKIQAAAFKQ